MGRLGLVLGSGAAGLEPAGSVARVSRHGDPYVLPHLIDHEANLRQLAGAGCDRVVGICSVGGLRADLGPGTLVCPDDFIALDAAPLTAHEGLAAHVVPAFDVGLRAAAVAALAGAGIAARDGGVYWQATGPRLETPAEVRFAAAHADVIGMTAASECVVAVELRLRYAAVCVVDNHANGVAGRELTLAEIAANRERNRALLARAVEALAAALG